MITLKSVVLPAPFGPIRAVTEFSSTSNVAPSTARMPPKCLHEPVDFEDGVFCGLRTADRELVDLNRAAQSPSTISSFFPKIPCGRKAIRRINTSPTIMKRTAASRSALMGRSMKRVPSRIVHMMIAPAATPQ